jgi:hypothetical protein
MKYLHHTGIGGDRRYAGGMQMGQQTCGQRRSGKPGTNSKLDPDPIGESPGSFCHVFTVWVYYLTGSGYLGAFGSNAIRLAGDHGINMF